MIIGIKVEIFLKHLSIEEIIKYVTANKVDKETLDLLSKVNGHIRNCPSCKEKVVAYETVNDEFKKETVENGLELNHIDDLIEIEKSINNER